MMIRSYYIWLYPLEIIPGSISNTLAPRVHEAPLGRLKVSKGDPIQGSEMNIPTIAKAG